MKSGKKNYLDGFQMDSEEEGGVESRVISRGHSRTGSHDSAHSQISAMGRTSVQDSPSFFGISDENVALWSDKTPSPNTTSIDSSATAAVTNTKSSRDPLLSMVKSRYPPVMEYETLSITKSELKDAPKPPGKMPKKASAGSLSNASNTSTSSSYKIGFLVNEFVVRDVLSMLKDCILDLNTVKFKLQSSAKDESGTKMSSSEELSKHLETMLNGCVLSSVEEGKLQQRISKLQQCVSEATWRFQLVAHEWLPSEPGRIIVDLHKVEDSTEEWGMLYQK